MSRAEVVVFQKWIVLSEVPPPEARREEFHGHHARACKRMWDGQRVEAWRLTKERTLTAAVWFVLHILGALVMRPSQTLTTLSLPPLARSCEARHQQERD